MKRTFVKSLTFCLLAVTAINCSKESPVAENPIVEPEMEPCTFNASIGCPEDSSKTSIGSITESEAAIVWNSGDQISIIPTTTDISGTGSMTTEAGGESASFAGEVPSGMTDFIAVYPYSGSASYSGGTISGFSIPVTQTASAGSFAGGASITIAGGTKKTGVAEVGDMTFSNLCAVIGFTLPSNITFASEVTVTAKSGANIAGGVSINAATPAITSADAASVTVNGTFEGGNTYYVCIAPGTYTDGFNFAIKTTGGNTYNRSTTKTLEAKAGGLYPLGKLSLELGASNFSTSVELSDKVSSSTLNGTDAKFTMSMNTSEFSSLFTLISYSVTFKDASGNTYRTLSGETEMPSSAVMTVASGKPYIPKGTYNYEVTVNYSVNNGVKDVDKSLTFTSDFSRTASPSGFALNASLTGYTSYSCYTGADGQSTSTTNANNCDNATVYSVGASYASGLSSEVYSQCSNLVSISSTLDGSAKSGNQGSQSWASHTIGATWSFDGASGTCAATKTVYVTGLPWQATPPTSKDSNTGWSFSGNYSTTNSSYLELGGNHGTGTPTAESNFSYYVPSGTIDVKVRTHIHTRTARTGWSSWNYVYYTTTFEFYVPSGTKIFSYGTGEVTEDQDRGYIEGTGTLSNGNSKVKMLSTYWARMENTYIRVYDLQILYK